MTKRLSLNTGLAALHALTGEKSPLGPLKVMAGHMGRFFQILIPGFGAYVVFGPEAVRKVLVTERDRVLWHNSDPVTDLLDRGVLVTDGREHDHFRSLMEPTLHPSRLANYAGMMTAQTDRVTSQWKDGQTVDMLIECRKIALLIIMQTLFSRDVWEDLPGIWNPIIKAIEYISPGAWIIWRKIPRFGFRRPLRELDRYLYGIIAERRGRKEGGRDLLQHLIEAGLPDNIIRDQMLTMLIAGHDTSTALLAWIFVLLGQHPETHRQLVKEMAMQHKPALLDQVIKESLRLYPPIHIGNRFVIEDMDFEGNKAPEGARLFYSIYLTHRDPAVWKNADDFCPERFAHGRTTPPMSYIPFGGGPRACIGAAFGQAEARIVIARLLQTFSFEPLNAGRIHAHMGATLEPRPGVMMKIHKRIETA